MVKRYAIIDIETTGGLHDRDKITEIAIIITDGVDIIEEFQTLVNPERSIPPMITGITGINDNMVVSAPKFYEIAKQIVDMTEHCIFVAHNVMFDYGFIKREFQSLGYAYNRKRLCTVKLARQTIRGLNGYGLDALCEHFGIDVANRHRAYDDTLATYKIFSWIYQNKISDGDLERIINRGIDATVLPEGMDIDELHDAPETTGVYYLSSGYDQVLYVGKAKNIRTRLFQHFRRMSRKSFKIHKRISKMHFVETGSELIALLLELHEIKTIQPEFNKALRRTNYPYALYYNSRAAVEKPMLIVAKHNKKNDDRYEKLRLLSSKLSADTYLQELISTYGICIKYCQSRQRSFMCSCHGSCQTFFEHPKDQIETALQDNRQEFDHDFVIILKGRHNEESGFVMIHDYRFWGFGYVPVEVAIHTREEWNDYIEYQFDYPEANGIVKTYMAKNRVTTIAL